MKVRVNEKLMMYEEDVKSRKIGVFMKVLKEKGISRDMYLPEGDDHKQAHLTVIDIPVVEEPEPDGTPKSHTFSPDTTPMGNSE